MSDAGGLAPGMFVRNPAAPEWGVGQVQSVIGHRVTVNFEHAGKRLITAMSSRSSRSKPAGGAERCSRSTG
jgi:hypothetical protein